MTIAVAASSRVRLHPLRHRRDGDEWIIGRASGGEFVAVPDTAAAAIRLLERGLTVAEVHDRLLARSGTDVDVADFVAALGDLGFLAAIDDVPLADAAPPVTFPRLRPAHVRWLVSRPLLLAVLAVLAAGAVTAVTVPGAVPGHADLLWSDRTGLVLAGNAALAWAMIFLHEFAHLGTARAYGVPGRLSLGTRLQFLSAQTDVTAVWAQPRRARLVVYLSGMAVHLTIAALALIGRAAAGPLSGPGRLLGAVVLLAVISVAYQFLVFMRTDVYFVLQDLTGARNLYADGSAYVRWWARARRGPEPHRDLPAAERRAVRAYAAVLAGGTAVCLAVAATVSLPFAVELLTRTVHGLTRHDSGAATVDAVLTVLVVGGFWVLWARAWWGRHGRRIRTWTAGRR